MAMTAQWDTYDQDRNGRTGQHSLVVEGPGTNGTFQIAWDEGGFELRDGGKSGKDLWPIIQPKSLRFTMRVENIFHEQFIKEIGSATDSSVFTVTYKRGVRTLFVGVILTEGVTYLDHGDILVDGARKKYGAFVVTAVDGLTLLQNKTFLFSLINTRKTLIEWIVQAFEDMPTFNKLVSNPFLFQTSWVPDTGSANFVLNQSVNARVFFESIKRTGGLEFPSQWDVLSEICKTFNMRLRNVYGFYFFQQIENLDATSYLYNKSGGYVGTNNIPSYVQDPDTDFLYLIAPHVQTWTPAVREAKVNYFFNFNPNLLDGFKFQSTSYAESCATDVSLVSIKNDETRLRIIGSIEYTPIITGEFTGQARPVFWLKIKVGNQYFARDLVTSGNYFHYQYATEEWTTTETKYYIIPTLITLPDSDLKKFYLPVYFSTLYMDQALDNEQLTICFGHELYDEDDTKLFETSIAVEAILDELDVSAIDRENQVVEPVAIETVLTNPAPNERSISREIYFSTGPNGSSGNRITDDSSPPVDTVDWTLPGLGSDVHYVQLTKSLMSRGIESQTWMNTIVRGAYQDLNRLRACGAEWIWWGGRYYHDQHMEHHQGDFFASKVFPVSFEAETEDKFDFVERPTKPTDPIGGRGEPVEREITGITSNRINADTYKIPMPDTTNWSHDQIRNIVTYNQGGNIRKYTENPTIENEYMFDSATRDFVLGENSRANLWHVFRVYT